MDEIREKIEKAIEILGKPVASYYPKHALKEYDEKIKSAVDILLSILSGKIAKESKEVSGKVKWFSKTKGYGFLTTEDGRDIFVSFGNFIDWEKAREGDEVKFKIIKEKNKGEQASDVALAQKIGGEKLFNEKYGLEIAGKFVPFKDLPTDINELKDFIKKAEEKEETYCNCKEPSYIGTIGNQYCGKCGLTFKPLPQPQEEIGFRFGEDYTLKTGEYSLTLNGIDKLDRIAKFVNQLKSAEKK